MSRPRGRGALRARETRPARGVVVAGVLGVCALVALGVQVGSGEPRDPPPDPEPGRWTGGRVRVEVENAGGVTGMARAATDRLRPVGFDVVRFGNRLPFDPDRPSTVVDRVGRTDVARAVADVLGIDNVLSDPDPNLYVDVTVVLGRDWSDRRRTPGAASASVTEPWDLRRLIGR